MAEIAAPDPPHEQLQLRLHLEQVLAQWGVEYRHEDVCEGDEGWTRCGWGTNILVPSRRGEISVWFDALDNDIAIYGARPYSEWLDLADMNVVLADVTTTLRRMLNVDPPRQRWWQRRHTSRPAP